MLDISNHRLDEGRCIPRCRASTDANDEVAQDCLAINAMMNLWMELNTPDTTVHIAYGTDVCVLGMANTLEAGWNLCDVITVTHPDFCCGRHSSEKILRIVDVHDRTSELTARCLIDCTTELMCNQLQAVADPEHRHAHREHVEQWNRSSLCIHARGSTREDNALW